jgi:predicted outer membrane repeat protein
MSHIRFALSSLLLLTVAMSAHAAPKNFHVGLGCTYGNIKDALDAERANPGDPADFIWIARNQSYTAQDIQVHDQNVFLYGGVDTCTDTSISGTTTLSGSGGAATSVMTISGASKVWLSALTITQGDAGSAGVGGGIHFAGTGTLKMSSTTITNNHAGYGAGINFNGTGGGANVAELWVNYETLITNNTATTSGGGIRIEGNAALRVLDDQVWIALNHADGGYGGGIQVLSPARAELGSPGYRFAEYLPLIYENTAKYGGGLAVHSIGNGQQADVRLFATNPLQPLGIEGNIASSDGGGIYVHGYLSGFEQGSANLCGTDYRIAANSAQEGSAIYDATVGSYIYLDRVNTYSGPSAYGACGGVDAAALGAQPCTSQNCNLIEGNVAQNISGQATAGSTVLLQAGSRLTADRIRLRGNSGAHSLRAINGDTYGTGATLHNCLIDGDTDGSDVVTAEANTSVGLFNCTIAGNQIGTSIVVRSAGILDLFEDIFAQGPTCCSLVYTGGNSLNLSIDYLLAMETASLAQGSHVVQGDPSFVDPAQGDYRLQPTSLAIDRAPPVAGDDRDLDDKPHDQDIVNVPNGDGVRDLGAYERQLRYCGAADTVFCNNFDFD